MMNHEKAHKINIALGQEILILKNQGHAFAIQAIDVFLVSASDETKARLFDVIKNS